MPKWQKDRVTFGLSILLGLALRLVFVLHAPRIAGDTLIYGDIAKNWIHHGVYGFADSSDGMVPTLIRLPGYPLFLAFCFRIFGDDQYTAVMLVQTLVDLATCVVLWGLARRIFGRRAAMVVLWMAVLCPFSANYVAAPLTETLTLATIALAFYGLQRWLDEGMGWSLWTSVIALALTYSLLLRPEQGLLAAAVVPAMLWATFRRPVRRVAALAPVVVVALCVVLPLLPWTIRNWRTFHVFEPLVPRDAVDPGELAPTGFNHWYRTWAIDFASTEEVYWNWNTSTIDIGDMPTRAFDTDEQYDRVNDLLEQYNKTSNATPQLEAGFAALAKERIEEDPVRYYLALPFARLVNMLLRPRVEMMEIDLEWWKWSKHRAQTVFAASYAMLNFLYFAMGIAGLWRWCRRRLELHTVLIWSTLAFFAMRCALLLTLDNSEPRYTLEFFPLLLLWTGALFASREAQTHVPVHNGLPADQATKR